MDIQGMIASWFQGWLQSLGPGLIRIGIFLVALLFVIIGFKVIAG